MNRRGFLATTVALSVPVTAQDPAKERFGGSGIYAKRGEKTYCEKGCHIGTFGNTVLVGAFPKEGDLICVPGMSIGASECPFCKTHVLGWNGGYFMRGSVSREAD